jgi:integrase
MIAGNNGKVVSVRSYQQSFECLLKNLHIDHKGFHSLRHTFATRAIECGMDIKTLSEILGHKNPTITLNRYAHSLMDHKREMMNKLGKLL